MTKLHCENFENGTGGWLQITGNGAESARTLERHEGAVVSRGPWWIDYNHAPPGGGYLHLLFCLHTADSVFRSQAVRQAGGDNRFIAAGFPTDLRGAQISVRLRGEVLLRGAQCLLLVQSKVASGKVIPFVLSGQPLAITSEYSSQTISLVPDPAQWTCLGARHDRGETYGWGEIGEVLRDVNVNVMLVLHPLDVAPAPPMEGDWHRLKAGEDFAVDAGRLPCGWVAMEEFRIALPEDGR